MTEELLTPEHKALTMNINQAIYGAFAEIGAGQEVARCFFRVGGAAGTVAKTMSAYDMKVSDDIYGKTTRYVSKDRLLSMLEHEYDLLIERLAEQRGSTTTFFAFANTVSARNFKGTNECHGWMGVRFQIKPGQPPQDMIVHVRMKDKENILQQQAIGTVGVNLIYAAFNLHEDPDRVVASLLDGLSVDRIEIDMMEVSGSVLSTIDNRIVSLKLLQQGLTNAVMFGANSTVYQPSEVLYKKPVLVERGSFRPITNVNVDMIKSAEAQFQENPEVKGKEVVPLLEITLKNLLSSGSIDLNDFLDRVDSVSALGYKVLVTNYPEFYLLPAYFQRYTKEPLAFVVGINHLLQIFEEHYYQNLVGGILEAFGRLFHNKLSLLVYPMSVEGYKRYIQATDLKVEEPVFPANKNIIGAGDVLLAPKQRLLLEYLIANGHIQNIQGANLQYLDVFSRDLLALIKKGDPAWERSVPSAAAAIIKERHLFARS